MKKTIKRCALVVCIFVFIFLMLPFITNSVTSGTLANSNSNKKEKGSPQIFTNNPLTDLVSRISNFFGSDKSKPQKLNQEKGSPQLAISPEEYLAQAKEKYENLNEEDPNDLSNSSTFGLYTQNEEGDWVLIPQTAPEGVVVAGMHEESIKANDYDRYLQQERTARLIPGVNNSLSAQENIPNSTMARIFNPIKNFFGFGNSDTVKASDVSSPSQLVATAKNPKEAKNPKNARKAPELNFSPKAPIKIDPSDEKSAEKALYSILDPSVKLEELADQLTDAKYPNPTTDEQKEEAAKYNKEIRAMFANKFNSFVDGLAQKDIALETANPFDAINACASGLTGNCDKEEVDIRALQQQNAEIFKTKLGESKEVTLFQAVMPKLHSVVIAKKVDEATFAAIEDINNPENPANVYLKQWEAKNCSKSDCFLVANSNAKGVEDTFRASNFENANISTASQNTQDTPYSIYTTQEIKQIIQQSRTDIASQNSDEKSPTLLWATAPSLALQVRESLKQQYGETDFVPVVLYTKEGDALDQYTHKTAKERSAEITSDLADITLAALDEVREIQQSAYGQILKEMLGPKIQEIEAEIKKNNKKNTNELKNLSNYK